MKVIVIGAGTMGNGITHVFAKSGYKVILVDISEEQLNKGIKAIHKNLAREVSKEKISLSDKEKALSNITTSTTLKDKTDGCELAIEAATESIAIKKRIFKELDELLAPNCILATNTSSISITELAKATNRPKKVIGMHFMNPVPIMKLVEVIRGKATSDKTTTFVMELSRKLEKSPVEVNDAPGFVANRILMPMINEAIFCVHEGVAGIEEVDTVMRLGMSHPMGPLFLADFIGLDVCLAIINVLYEGFNIPKYAPCPLLVDMVKNGELGVKSKQGFYDYEAGIKEKVVAQRFLR